MSNPNATYDSTAAYPRDLVGYGRQVPHAQWPNQARIAVQFVLNYEEGGENATVHGDAGSEMFLSEMFNPPSFPDRHLSMEGIYEYGSRVGVWRILREFEKRGLPLTVFGVSMALERHPELTQAFVELGHEIACHGWRWIHYQNLDEATERAHMARCVEAIATLTGEIEQRPSAVSAIRVDGQRAYDRVRAGEDVVLASRAVRVDRFDVLATRRTEEFIDLDVVVDCSSGTYIRALARDLGAALGVGGHLTALRRTRVGGFGIDRAVTPEDISEDGVVPAADVAATLFPVWSLTEDEERDLRHGKKVTTAEPDAKLVAAVRHGVLVAIVSISKGVARVETGFPE